VGPYLASFDTYPVTGVNARFDLLILRRPLWGGRFQVSVREGGRLPAGIAGILEALKAGDALDTEGVWLSDKCRIRGAHFPIAIFKLLGAVTTIENL